MGYLSAVSLAVSSRTLYGDQVDAMLALGWARCLETAGVLVSRHVCWCHTHTHTLTRTHTHTHTRGLFVFVCVCVGVTACVLV